MKLPQPLRATLAFQAGACRGIRGVRFCDGTVTSNYSEAPAPVKIPRCQEDSAGLAGGAPAPESPEDPLGRRPSVLIKPTPVLFHCTITARPRSVVELTVVVSVTSVHSLLNNALSSESLQTSSQQGETCRLS